MKQPSVYLKMRVLGAVDTVPGRTRHERVHNVAAMTFLDEEGNPRQFTWRTIQTWFYRYKNHGITGMTNQPRKDKGQARKVTPEELLEALNAARPHFHDQRTNKRALYRFCIEKGLLQPDRIAQTTFYRFIREYDLLAPDDDDNKKRLAFSMKYANQLWQADTMFGPYVDTGVPAARASRPSSSPSSTTPAASSATASSSSRKTSTPWCRPSAPPSTNAASPSNSSSTTAPSTAPRKSPSSAPASAASCATPPSATPPPRAKSNASSAASATSSSSASSTSPRSKPSTASSPTGSKTTTTPPPHDALGMKPIDRFGIDLARVRFLPPSEHNDELFYAEATRKVKKDNTFSFAGRRYETPVDLRDKEIQLRYDRHRQRHAPAVIIYHKGQRMGAARLLDAVANGLSRRKEQP